MILLDTHVWVWWILRSPQLPRAFLDAIERERNGDGVAILAISCWEIAHKAEAGKRLMTGDGSVDYQLPKKR